MGLPRKLLGDGEREVLHVRTHAKVLIWPAVLFIVAAALVGVGIALLPSSWSPIGTIVVVALAVLVVIIWVVVPFLRWRTTTYTVTNRRIITRRGILNKQGHDLPLIRINDVSYEHSLIDRMLGCGTLRIKTASDTAPLVLPDVPDVERTHVQITELLFGGNDRSGRDHGGHWDDAGQWDDNRDQWDDNRDQWDDDRDQWDDDTGRRDVEESERT